MKHLFSTSLFRNPVFFILVIFIFAIMLASGLRVSSGTVIPASTVTAATTETVEPMAAEPAATSHSLTNALAANSAAAFFAPTITATKTYMPAGNASPGATLTYMVVISNTGTMDATAVNFSDTVDANTTIVGVNGSLIVSPIAVNDTYNTIGNVNIDVPAAQGLLANDLNPNGSGTLTILTPPTTTTGGGTLSINTTTGAFTYNPPVNYRTATDTFMYTLDNGTGKTDTATVTINVSGMIWFIDDSSTDPAGGDGRLSSPFKGLVGTDSGTVKNFSNSTSDIAGDNIFLFSGAYTGGHTLLNTQRLLGQGAPDSILAITGFTAPSGNTLLPATNGTDPTITTAGVAAITLGQNDELHGFTVGNTGAAGTDVSGTTFMNLTVKDVTLNGDGRALNLMTGTIVSGSTFATLESSGGSPAEGIRLNTVGGAFTVTTTNIVAPTGTGIDVQSTPMGTNFNFGSTTVNKSNSGAGINLATNIGIFSFSSLTLTTTAGTALTASSSGTVNVTSGTISATGGAALNVSSTAAGMTYSTVGSTNSSTTGINLATVTGSLSITTTTIDNSTGVGISQVGSSATVNYGTTTVNNTAGTGVVLGTSGSGNVGTITFGDLDIDPDNNARCLHAVDNTMNITVTSGTINATGAVAVEITRSSSATPLAVSLTSVSANGGSNGIILTRTSGSFTITGNNNLAVGGDNSGGTIQDTTSDGISLTNAQNLSFTNVRIQGTTLGSLTGSGIRGTQVTNFTFKNGRSNNVGHFPDVTNTFFDESNIRFDTSSAGTEQNLSGTVTITNNILDNATWHGVDILNFNGTISDIIVTGNLLTSGTTTGGSGTSKGSAIRIQALGSASTVSNITKGTFANNIIANFPGGAGISIQGGNSNTTGGPGGTMGTPGNVTNIISITGNRVTGQSAANRMGTSCIIAGLSGGNAGSRSQGNFDISNNGTVANPLGDNAGTTIGIGNNGYATMTATITNNVIVANNTVGSQGIGGGNGVVIGCALGLGSCETPDLTLTVTNNTISQTDGNGILLVARGNRGNAKIGIRNNNVAGPLAGVRQGIRVDAGNGAANEIETLCLDISGNTSAPTVGQPAALGIGIRKESASTFGIEGLSPSPATGPQMETFIAGNNPAGGGVLNISTSGGDGTNYTSCNTAPLAPDGEEIAPSALRESDGAGAAPGGRDILYAPRGEAPKNDTDDKVQKLTQAELAWMVQAALERWRLAGISGEAFTRLQTLRFEIADLPDSEIAKVEGNVVKIDELAAGYGWFYDLTPWQDNEFTVGVPERELQTTEQSMAHGQMDLLTVLMRELGKEYLKEYLKDQDPKVGVPQSLRPLMEATLSPSVRRLPDASGIGFIIPQAPEIVIPKMQDQTASTRRTRASAASMTNPAVTSQGAAGTLAPQSGETVSKMLGTIPAGESVTIMFQVTVDNPFPAGVCTVSNQGTVSGSNFSNVLTDDPSVGGSANPTMTTIVKPVVIGACPSNITGNTDAGLCTRVVTYTTPTADGCPVPTVTCAPPSGMAFAKGVTTVTCTASNAPGVADDSVCTFTVTVNDAQAPVFANCTNLTANTAAGVCTAVVNFTTTLNDNCPGQTFSCTPASGSTFMKGVTTVTCTGQDAATPPNAATPCIFTVTVSDNQAPALSCPSSVAVNNDPGVCTAVVNFTTPTATDNCPPTSFLATCVPPSGTAFAKGVTTVTCTASDTASPTPNTTTCMFTVTVSDNEKPKSCVTPPANMISWWSGDGNANDIQGVSPNNNNGTLNGGATATASGKVGQAFSFNGSGQWVSVANSSSINLTGSAVTIDGWINPNSNASDAVYFGKSANAANDFVLLYQFSNISAIIKAGGTETTINTGVSPTLGVWTHIALVYDGTDMRVYVNGVLSGAPTLKTGSLAGSNVPFGIGGRTGGLFFNGLIDEVELFNRALSAAEILSIFNAQSFGKCKPVVVNTAAGICTATNTYTNPTFTDNCTGATIVCSPLANTPFPKGVTTVTCTITDTATPTANTFMNSFEVRVVDNQAPTMGACPTNITMDESSPGSGSATVTYTNPTSADNCPGQTVTCTPASGSSFPVGTTTVTCQATDASGNTSAPCTFTVQINPLCTVNCPSSITVNTEAGVCTAVVIYPAPTTTGSCGAVTCSPASGATFPKGVTTVTCTPTVAAPPCTFTITVVDNQAPTLPSGCPASQTVNTAAGVCTAVVTYTNPVVADNCPGATVSCSPASGGTFPKGVTTVTCTATDTATIPNTATCTFTVTVVDNQAPTFPSGCPANQTINTAAGVCTAVVTYSDPAVADNCPGATVACSPASGTTFNKGVTTVTCTATDTATVPNTATCTFTITVVDNQAPTFPSGCPANQSVNTAAGQCQATVSYTDPTIADNCPGATVSCSPASGGTFPKGVTTVTCTATDTATIPNTATCTFTITVVDNQAPTFPSGCPANQIVNTAAGVCTAVATYSDPTVADNCPGATVVCVPASGTTFNKGVTTVTCTATDTATIPNTATCTFTITVVDNQAPTFPSGCPANQTVNTGAGVCTAVVTYTNPAVADNCPGATVSCTPASGGTFPKGVTTVTCTATDTATIPNTATCTFTITVVDNQAPTFPSGCPANQTVNTAAGVCTAIVTYSNPAVADNCPGATVSCSPASGGTFPKGVTTVTCTATDTATIPNTATCTFTVTVVDNQAPTFPKGCPANQTVTTAGSCAIVTYANPTISDNCPGATVVCSPASGTCFPIGTTTVTCTATDTATIPNTASCSFTVTVVPCTITCPANITRANDPNQCGAVVTFAPTTTGSCGTVSCTPPSGAFFAIGVTTVSCTTTVGPSCSFTVTVSDAQAPQITCPANQAKVTVRPGDSSVVVNYPAPVVTDNCPAASVVCTPPSGSVFVLGVTTVSCTATDAVGNTASCSFTVTVFDVCLQDDSGTMMIFFNTQTGDYRFCCNGSVFMGKGKVVKQGNTWTLTHNSVDRRVLARVDGNTNSGTGSLQSPPGVVRCSFSDRDFRNNTCLCQ